MTGTGDRPVDRLLAALEAQDRAVSELHELSARQPELIREARTDGLLALLGRRQALIDRMTALQAETARHAEAVERGPAPDEGTRARVRGLVDRIEASLAAVMARDAEDQRALAESRDEVRAELAGLDAGLQARRAYAAGPIAPRFADRRG